MKKYRAFLTIAASVFIIGVYGQTPQPNNMNPPNTNNYPNNMPNNNVNPTNTNTYPTSPKVIPPDSGTIPSRTNPNYHMPSDTMYKKSMRVDSMRAVPPRKN